MPEPQQPPRPRTSPAEARGITTSCPRCGVLHLASPAFVLVVCPQDPERSFYQFTCPRCTVLVTRHASERTVKGMTSCGVPASTLPAEALEPKVGPLLTMDDLLDLVLQLDTFEVSMEVSAEVDAEVDQELSQVPPVSQTTLTIPEDRVSDMAGDVLGDSEL